MMVILDEFTRYAEAFPIKNQMGETAADILFHEYMPRFGLPEEIITDQGGCFMGELFTTLCKQLEVKKIHTAAYRPEANGGNERVHGTLYTILRLLSTKFGKDWKLKLPLALYVYRNTVHKAHSMMPHEALFGYVNRHITLANYRPDSDESYDERIIRLREVHQWMQVQMEEIQANRNYNINKRNRTIRVYQPGDLVKFKLQVRNKLEPHWCGPAEVIRRIGPVDYELKLPDEHNNKHPVIHTAYLRPFYDIAEQNDHDLTDADSREPNDTNAHT